MGHTAITYNQINWVYASELLVSGLIQYYHHASLDSSSLKDTKKELQHGINILCLWWTILGMTENQQKTAQLV